MIKQVTELRLIVAYCGVLHGLFPFFDNFHIATNGQVILPKGEVGSHQSIAYIFL